MKRLYQTVGSLHRFAGRVALATGIARNHDDRTGIWPTLIDRDSAMWAEARHRAREGPRVLMATNIGGLQQAVTLESLLAVALTLRGAQVEALLCDAALPSCQLAQISDTVGPRVVAQDGIGRRLCRLCRAGGEAIYAPLVDEIHHLTRLLSEDERHQAANLARSVPHEDIPLFTLDGSPLGEHAMAGALRFYGRGDLDGEPLGPDILRQYLRAAILSYFATNRLFGERNYTSVCMHHGIYVPQGVVLAAAKRAGKRAVTWNPSYRTGTFIFSHGDTYHRTMLAEHAETWETLKLNGEDDELLSDYLLSRTTHERDWIWFHEAPKILFADFAGKAGIDLSKPCIGLLTNVVWDAKLHYSGNAYPSMLDWLRDTISHFARRDDLQLLIRIHPAEVRGTLPSRQRVQDELMKAFPVLPPNVFVIAPDQAVSTYEAMGRCDAVLVYATKTAIELASRGIPVITAGEAYVRGKGITIDAHTRSEYLAMLDRLPFNEPLDKERTDRARKYAYHFFFRRMIPLPFVVPNSKSSIYDLAISSLEDLLPGNWPGLDIICDGIMQGTPFVYPAEQLGLQDQKQRLE